MVHYAHDPLETQRIQFDSLPPSTNSLTPSKDETLLLQIQLRKAPNAPESCDLSFLRAWLRNPSLGNQPISSPDGDIYARTSTLDLLSLSPPKSTDPLSHFFISTLTTLWHRLFGRHKTPVTDEESQLSNSYVEYSNKAILRVAAGLGSLLSSILLVVSILVLHFVTNMPVRLGLVAVFTTVFSLALMILTNARKVEVFAGTTA